MSASIRSLLTAGAVIAALSSASPASAAVTALDVEYPEMVEGVRYVGPAMNWYASATHDGGASLSTAAYWVTRRSDDAAIYGSASAPRTAEVWPATGTGEQAVSEISVYAPPGSEAPLVDGVEYDMHFRLTEEGGAPQEFVRAFTADTVAPTGLTRTLPGGETTDATPTFAGTTSVGVRDTRWVYGWVDRGTSSSSPDYGYVGSFNAEVDSSGAWSTDNLTTWSEEQGETPVPLTKGAYTGHVEHCDSAGNCQGQDFTFEVVEAPAPTQSPTTAPASPADIATPAPSPSPAPTLGEPAPTAVAAVRATIRNARTGVRGSMRTLLKPLIVSATAVAPGQYATCFFLGRGTAGDCLRGRAAAATVAPKKARKAGVPKNLLAWGVKTFAAPGKGSITVKPSKTARARLKGRKNAKVTVVTVFRPAGGGAATTASMTVTLTR